MGKDCAFLPQTLHQTEHAVNDTNVACWMERLAA